MDYKNLIKTLVEKTLSSEADDHFGGVDRDITAAFIKDARKGPDTFGKLKDVAFDNDTSVSGNLHYLGAAESLARKKNLDVPLDFSHSESGLPHTIRNPRVPDPREAAALRKADEKEALESVVETLLHELTYVGAAGLMRGSSLDRRDTLNTQTIFQQAGQSRIDKVQSKFDRGVEPMPRDIDRAERAKASQNVGGRLEGDFEAGYRDAVDKYGYGQGKKAVKAQMDNKELAVARIGSRYTGPDAVKEVVEALLNEKTDKPASKDSAPKAKKGDDSASTDTSSDTASDTSTETSTKTSTDAYTQGNITVTGGAGRGATNVTISIPRGAGGDPAQKASDSDGSAKKTKK